MDNPLHTTCIVKFLHRTRHNKIDSGAWIEVKTFIVQENKIKKIYLKKTKKQNKDTAQQPSSQRKNNKN